MAACFRAAKVLPGEVVIKGLQPSGHIEVTALGELAFTNPPAVAALPQGSFYRELIAEPGGPEARRDCSAIDTAWESGIWEGDPGLGWSPPRDSLSGSVQLVDFERGLGLSTTTLALADFNVSVLHRDVRVDPIDLADADPATSRIVREEGALQSSWTHSVDAVTAVLMSEVVIEYWQVPGLAITSDLVVTLPTFAFYDAQRPGPFAWNASVRRDGVPRLGFSFVDRSGRPHDRYDLGYRAKLAECTPPSRQDHRAALDRPMLVLSQRPETSLDPQAAPLVDYTGYEPCLDTTYVEVLPDAFTGRAFSTTDADEFVSVEGHRFAGLPGVVTALARSQDSFEGRSFGFQLPTSRQVRVFVPAAK